MRPHPSISRLIALALTFLASHALAASEFAVIKEAAQSGDPEAQEQLGIMYSNGEGVPKDQEKAALWFTKAAKQGRILAQWRIGSMYYSGVGVHRDYRKAVDWLTKAAEKGDGVSQGLLGTILLGESFFMSRYTPLEGAPRNPKKAMEWTTKAAMQGHSSAQSELGRRYRYGKGVPIDYVQAYAWMHLAHSKDSASAKTGLPQLRRELSPQQIERAEELSRTYAKTIEGLRERTAMAKESE